MKSRITVLIAGLALAVVLVSWPAGRTAPPGEKTKATKATPGWTLDEALAEFRLNPKDTYLQYVVLQLANREGKFSEVAQEIDRDNWGGRGRGRRADLFSVFTGALAVQESLQLDSMRARATDQRGNPVMVRPVKDGGPEKEIKPPRVEVKVDTLEGPKAKSHPWKKMLAGKKPDISPLARCVPDDFCLVEFKSLSKLLDVMEVGDLAGTHASNQAFREARSLNVGDRLKTQLVMETNPKLKPFYDLVVEEVGIAASDMFLREGSDVTMIFRFKQAPVFKARMDSFLDNAGKTRKDAKRTTGEYLGVKYVQLATPERDISVISAYPEANLHVRGNSLAAFKRIIEAIKGKDAQGKPVVRLGDTDEYAYIRTLFPRGAKEEDGLIYLSDPFIRHMVSAQLKLTERRRILCHNHLHMIGHGSMMYRTETGKRPANLSALFDTRCCPSPFREPPVQVDAQKINQLVKDLDSNTFGVRQKATRELEKLGLIAEPFLKKELGNKPSLETRKRVERLLAKLELLLECPDGGTYSLSADGTTGICSHHGQAHFLTPCCEIPVTKVMSDEADEYKNFMREYNEYWRTFFDPIAIRVQVTPERLRMETIILPLINNSIYQSMAMALGGKPEPLDAQAVPKRNIFSVAVRVNKEALLKELGPGWRGGFDRMVYELARAGGLQDVQTKDMDIEKFVSKGLGNQVGFHLYDAPPMFDFNTSEFLGLFGRNRLDEGTLAISFLAASFHSPVYLSIPVQDEKIVDHFGEQLEQLFARAARQHKRDRWIGDMGMDYYLVPFSAEKERKARCVAVKIGPLKLRFFYARIGKNVYIASKMFILDDLLALEKERAKAPLPRTSSTMPAHAMIRIRPENWKQVLPDFRLGWGENHREACFNNLGPLATVGRAYTSSLGKTDAKELALVAERIQKEAEHLHGSHFFCPEGGKYELGPDRKHFTCNVHGSILLPKQPAIPDDKSSFGKLMKQFQGLTVTLTFLEDGLHAVAIIDRK